MSRDLAEAARASQSMLRTRVRGFITLILIVAANNQTKIHDDSCHSDESRTTFVQGSSTTPLLPCRQYSAAFQRALDLCLVQLHQLGPHQVAFYDPQALGYSL
jgi:hypothetical protein